MADLKISQLTGATTPLAGTEVVPIVQGGSTKKVSVSNLTEGRTVRASRVGIGAGAPTYALDIINAETQLVSRMLNQETVGNSISTQIISAGNGAVVYQLDNDGLGSVFGQGVRAGTTTNSFYNLMSNGTDRLSIAAGGNVTVNTGNVVLGTAGKGIDFSANTHAAGMTSELLNDYEEGTWTPTLATNGFSGGVTLSSASGTYTKIGRQVTLQCTLNLSNFAYPLTLIEIGDIPYTPATRNAGAYMGAHPSSSMGGACGVTNGGSVIYIPPSVATGTSTVWAVTITYFV